MKKCFANFLRYLTYALYTKKSWKRDLNPRPTHYECVALPTELFQPIATAMYLFYTII